MTDNMGEADTFTSNCVDLLDLGDVSQDLEALSPASCAVGEVGDKVLRTDFSEDSAAEHDYDNISSPGGSSTCSGPTYKRHIGFGPPGQTSLKVEDVCSGVSPPSPLKTSPTQPQLIPSRHRLSSQTSLEPRPKEARKKKKKNLLCPSYEETTADPKGPQIERVNTKIGGGKFGVLSSRSRHKKGKIFVKGCLQRKQDLKVY